MEDINVHGTTMMDDEEFPALLTFSRAEGGKLVVLADDEKSKNVRQSVMSRRFYDSEFTEEELSFWFKASYDLDTEQPIAKNFLLTDCLSLGGGAYWGQTGAATTANFHVHKIQETNIIWGEDEEHVYDKIVFSYQNIGEWMTSMGKIDIMWEEASNKNSSGKWTISETPIEAPPISIPGLGKLCLTSSSSVHRSHDTAKAERRYTFAIEVDDSEAPLNVKDVIGTVVAIQDIMQLGTNQMILIDEITMHLQTLSPDAYSRLYFSPAEPTQLELSKKRKMNRFNFFFSYEDIGGLQGVGNWLTRMRASESQNWDEKLMIALLFEGHHRKVFGTEYNIMPVITSALMLAGTSEKTIAARLQSLILSQMEMSRYDKYFDGTWCDALAMIRNKCVAHPEQLNGAKFPGGAALRARELLYRICVSFIVKEMLALHNKKADDIIERLWSHHHSKEYLKAAKEDDIKEWYNQLISRDLKTSDELTAEQKKVAHKSKPPPALEKLRKDILGSPVTSDADSYYVFKCEDCGCEWRSLKHGRGKHEVSVNGYLNSSDSDNWECIGTYSNKQEANEAVRESVASHFCVPLESQ